MSQERPVNRAAGARAGDDAPQHRRPAATRLCQRLRALPPRLWLFVLPTTFLILFYLYPLSGIITTSFQAPESGESGNVFVKLCRSVLTTRCSSFSSPTSFTTTASSPGLSAAAGAVSISA